MGSLQSLPDGVPMVPSIPASDLEVVDEVSIDARRREDGRARRRARSRSIASVLEGVPALDLFYI